MAINGYTHMAHMQIWSKVTKNETTNQKCIVARSPCQHPFFQGLLHTIAVTTTTTTTTRKTCVVALLYVDSHFVDNIMILHGAPQSQPTARQSHMGPKIMGFAEAKPTNEKGDMLPLMANMGVSKDYRFWYIPNLCIPQNRKFNGGMIVY